jgi:hypothetical protein
MVNFTNIGALLAFAAIRVERRGSFESGGDTSDIALSSFNVRLRFP